jgi:hypothetical protein
MVLQPRMYRCGTGIQTSVRCYSDASDITPMFMSTALQYRYKRAYGEIMWIIALWVALGSPPSQFHREKFFSYARASHGWFWTVALVPTDGGFWDVEMVLKYAYQNLAIFRWKIYAIATVFWSPKLWIPTLYYIISTSQNTHSIGYSHYWLTFLELNLTQGKDLIGSFLIWFVLGRDLA